MLKAFALKAAALFINTVSAVFRLLRRPSDRIVFISRQYDEPSANFTLLLDEMRRLEPGLEYGFSCRLGLRDSMGPSYIPLLIKQLWMLAGARACVTESYSPAISVPKSHGRTRVVQIWHSMVAIKRFGWQTVGLPEGSDPLTAEIMRMHAGYDAVVCGSDHQRRFFAEAMRVPAEKIYALGTPSADRLINMERGPCADAVRAKYPRAAGKRAVAYLPTMRRGRAVPWRELAEAAGDGCFIIIGLHPLDSFTEASDTENAVFEKELSSRELMLGCDAVISDYSGAAAEAAICGCELYFYTPDKEEYSADCGLNIDPAGLFPEISSDSAAGMAALLSRPYPDGAKARCRELLAGGCDGRSTEKIAKLVLYGADNAPDGGALSAKRIVNNE